MILLPLSCINIEAGWGLWIFSVHIKICNNFLDFNRKIAWAISNLPPSGFIPRINTHISNTPTLTNRDFPLSLSKNNIITSYRNIVLRRDSSHTSVACLLSRDSISGSTQKNIPVRTRTRVLGMANGGKKSKTSTVFSAIHTKKIHH